MVNQAHRQHVAYKRLLEIPRFNLGYWKRVFGFEDLFGRVLQICLDLFRPVITPASLRLTGQLDEDFLLRESGAYTRHDGPPFSYFSVAC